MAPPKYSTPMIATTDQQPTASLLGNRIPEQRRRLDPTDCECGSESCNDLSCTDSSEGCLCAAGLFCAGVVCLCGHCAGQQIAKSCSGERTKPSCITGTGSILAGSGGCCGGFFATEAFFAATAAGSKATAAIASALGIGATKAITLSLAVTGGVASGLVAATTCTACLFFGGCGRPKQRATDGDDIEAGPGYQAI